MRIIFDLAKRQFVSIFSTLLISSFFLIFLVSFIVSDRVIDSFLSSEYFKQKLKDELIKYDIVFEKVNVLKVGSFRNTKIAINGLSNSNNTSIKAGKTALEIDLLSLFLSSSYINELVIEELFFEFPSHKHTFSNLDIDRLTKDLNFSLEKILNKTKTNSILIKSFFIKNSNVDIIIENLNLKKYEKIHKINASLTLLDVEKKKAFTSDFELETQDNFSTVYYTSKLKFNQSFVSKVLEKTTKYIQRPISWE